MQKTLPQMPITNDLADVEEFIRLVKSESYFQEVAGSECKKWAAVSVGTDLLERAVKAGFMTVDELAAAKDLAVERYMADNLL